MRLLSIILFALLLRTSLAYSAVPTECGLYLNLENPTASFITYVTQLNQRGTVKNHELDEFITKILEGRIENPIHPSRLGTDTSAFHQYKGIESYLRTVRLDLEQLSHWARSIQDRRAALAKERLQTDLQTKDSLYQEINFVRLDPGTFEVGDHLNRTKARLTYSIEVMTTPVTQKMWVEVMGENSSVFNDGFDSELIVHDGRKIRLQPNHPVENISWLQAARFANLYSLSRGYESVYDLETQKNLIPVFETNGYRLPTEIEQEYILSTALKHNLRFKNAIESGDKKVIGEYAWIKANSRNMTHEVGSLKSLQVPGGAIYDLFGNVWEWSNDRFKEGKLSGGINPLGPDKGRARAIRGSAFYCPVSSLNSYDRGSSDGRNETIGLRLVRTLR